MWRILRKNDGSSHYKERAVTKRLVGGVGVLAFFMASSAANAQAPRPNAGSARPTVTYAKDVAPILYSNCTECHRPSMSAPMSLMTYEDVRPWARAIKQRVVAREMPPWSTDAPHGTFK